jgi:hypothetical protein
MGNGNGNILSGRHWLDSFIDTLLTRRWHLNSSPVFVPLKTKILVGDETRTLWGVSWRHAHIISICSSSIGGAIFRSCYPSLRLTRLPTRMSLIQCSRPFQASIHRWYGDNALYFRSIRDSFRYRLLVIDTDIRTVVSGQDARWYSSAVHQITLLFCWSVFFCKINVLRRSLSRLSHSYCFLWRGWLIPRLCIKKNKEHIQGNSHGSETVPNCSSNKARVWGFASGRTPWFALVPPPINNPLLCVGKITVSCQRSHNFWRPTQFWILLSFPFNMCKYHKTTTSKPFLAGKYPSLIFTSPSQSFVVIPNGRLLNSDNFSRETTHQRLLLVQRACFISLNRPHFYEDEVQPMTTTASWLQCP